MDRDGIPGRGFVLGSGIGIKSGRSWPKLTLHSFNLDASMRRISLLYAGNCC